MALVRLERETMVDIADAVREKAGTTSEYYASEIPEAIRGIPSDSGSSSLSESAVALLDRTIQECIDTDGKCSVIGPAAFYECSSLKIASFPACTTIYTLAFACCAVFESLYLLGSSRVALLNDMALNETPMLDSSYLGHFGSIYVPSSLYDDYVNASDWSTYSARFVGVNPADYGM